MNSKVFMVVRILLGLFVLVFGLDKFFHFVPMDQSAMSEAAMGYMGGLAAAKTIYLVAIVEILAGLALLFNKYGALMALILMSVSVNAVLFHATLEPATIPGSLILIVLNVLVLFGYKAKYKDLLAG
ncbi:DoxX family membrane protein [Allomuricauda sp. SCSIO 65647]|uniref:DoxX family membrane protein n=1 Tax=Allomuricauda sp. SCSIO 65647 TaxID=2908843 RepID=UPI001F16136C|nr:DoxX family membrane protein [Muricauda sp. SCSIO 65647]UJH66535.1 DoxX family membrane protein [Muricauda sp. SCSIO 65647]